MPPAPFSFEFAASEGSARENGTTNVRTLRTTLWCCAVVALAGCGPSQVGSRFVKSQDVKAAQGAVIEVDAADSSALQGTRLALPGGALAHDTTITLELGSANLVAPSAVASPVAVWEPSGLQFSQPATLTLPIDLPVGSDTSHLNIAVQEADGTTFRIPHNDLTISASRVTFQIDGFTSFQANTQATCSTDSDCASGESCVNGGCQGNSCQADTDCPSGEACRNGSCTGGTGGGAGGGGGCSGMNCGGGSGGGTGGGTGGGCSGANCACQVDTDCASGEACRNGVCTTGTGGGAGGGGCSGMNCGGGSGGGGCSGMNCGGGSGGGGGGGPTCQVDSDCPMNEVCYAGYCYGGTGGGAGGGSGGGSGGGGGTLCRQDSDCFNGEICDANTGYCVVANDGGPFDGGSDGGMGDGGASDGGSPDAGLNCQVDTDCNSPDLCVQNVCTAVACDPNRPCPGNYTCVNNWCQ